VDRVVVGVLVGPAVHLMREHRLAALGVVLLALGAAADEPHKQRVPSVMASRDEQLEDLRVRNKALLESLRGKRVALDQHRQVEHHFWAASQKSAALLARELYVRGFLVLKIAPSDGDPPEWGIDAERKSTALQAASEETVREMVDLARRFESIYDGWGTAV
jgi:regulator of RNase E activity RraB